MADTITYEQACDTEHTGKIGRTMYERLRPKLEPLHNGNYIVIDVQTGEYVTGATMSAACDAFERKYGKIPAYVRRIGRHLRV